MLKNGVLVLLLYLLFGAPVLTAQTVINTEDLRLRADTQEVKGLVNLGFGMSRNKAGRFLRPAFDARLEINKNRYRWLILGGYALTRFTDTDLPGASAKNFNNRGFAHVRYNRPLSRRLTLEVFTQYQFDLIQEIDYRILTGVGPRVRWLNREEAYLFTGASYMYENERTSDDEEGLVSNLHHRLNFYGSGGVQFNAHVRFNSTVYFQPRPDIWSDFRVSSIHTLTTSLGEVLSFRTSLNFVYDARPPLSVPEVMYDLSAGFVVNW